MHAHPKREFLAWVSASSPLKERNHTDFRESVKSETLAVLLQQRDGDEVANTVNLTHEFTADVLRLV